MQHYKVASEPVSLTTLHLSKYAGCDADHKDGGGLKSNCSNSSDNNSHTTVDVQLAGNADACVIWFELVGSTGHTLSTRPHSSGAAASTAHSRGSNSVPDNGKSCSRPVVADYSTCFGLGLYYVDQPVQVNSTSATPTVHLQQQQKTITVSAAITQQLRLDILVSSRSSRSSRSSNSPVSESSSGAAASIEPASPVSYTWSPHGTPQHAYLPR